MSATNTASTRTERRSLAERLARLHADLVRDGWPVADMRKAQSLELTLSGVNLDGVTRRSSFASVEIDRLEAPFDTRPIVPAAPKATKFGCFLDGAQNTKLVWRIGVTPITLTVAAAAILTRDAKGDVSIRPGTFQLKEALIVPGFSSDPELQRLIEVMESRDLDVLDPLEKLEPDLVEELRGDYARMHDLTYQAASDFRAALERETLQTWLARPDWESDDCWLLLDGPLPVPEVQRTVGLVKQFTERHLTPQEMAILLSLPQGHRTTAFAPPERWHEAGFAADTPREAQRHRTLWYLRLWEAEGMDARHALVRVEAGPDLRSTEEIDEVSSWLLAERTPRAMGDSRWATLLYPIHYLERILKRRLESEFRGWPGA